MRLIYDLIILMRDIYINPPCTCTQNSVATTQTSRINISLQWPIQEVSDAGILVWVPTLNAQVEEKLIHKTSAI